MKHLWRRLGVFECLVFATQITCVGEGIGANQKLKFDWLESITRHLPY